MPSNTLRWASSLLSGWATATTPAALHNNLADLLHEANQSADSMLHLKEAVKLFAVHRPVRRRLPAGDMETDRMVKVLILTTQP